MKPETEMSSSSANKSDHLSRSSSRPIRVNLTMEIRVIFANNTVREAREYKRRKLFNISSNIKVSNQERVVLL